MFHDKDNVIVATRCNVMTGNPQREHSTDTFTNYTNYAAHDMTTDSATAGWEQVEDKYYRKILLYSALWDADFDLSDYIVAGAPYGGALGKLALIQKL